MSKYSLLSGNLMTDAVPDYIEDSSTSGEESYSKPDRGNCSPTDNQRSSREQSYYNKNRRKNDDKTTCGHSSATCIIVQNASGVHIGNNYQKTIHINNLRSHSKKENKNDALGIFSSLQQVNESDIRTVSEDINKDKWQTLGKHLGFQEDQLNLFKQKNTNDLKEATYEMLLQWIHVNTRIATVGRLCHCLSIIGEIKVVNKLS